MVARDVPLFDWKSTGNDAAGQRSDERQVYFLCAVRGLAVQTVTS